MARMAVGGGKGGKKQYLAQLAYGIYPKGTKGQQSDKIMFLLK